MFQVGQLFQTVALKKIKNIGTIPKDSILVKADVVGLYPSMRRDLRL